MADGALAVARRAFAAECEAAISTPGVDVLQFDPVEVVPPVVTISTAGVTPTAWRFTIRIYVDAGQSEAAQTQLDNVLTDLEDGLGDSAPRVGFADEFDEKKGVWVMVGVAEVGREDF